MIGAPSWGGLSTKAIGVEAPGGHAPVGPCPPLQPRYMAEGAAGQNGQELVGQGCHPVNLPLAQLAPRLDTTLAEPLASPQCDSGHGALDPTVTWAILALIYQIHHFKVFLKSSWRVHYHRPHSRFPMAPTATWGTWGANQMPPLVMYKCLA